MWEYYQTIMNLMVTMPNPYLCATYLQLSVPCRIFLWLFVTLSVNEILPKESIMYMSTSNAEEALPWQFGYSPVPPILTNYMKNEFSGSDNLTFDIHLHYTSFYLLPHHQVPQFWAEDKSVCKSKFSNPGDWEFCFMYLHHTFPFVQFWALFPRPHVFKLGLNWC